MSLAIVKEIYKLFMPENLSKTKCFTYIDKCCSTIQRGNADQFLVKFRLIYDFPSMVKFHYLAFDISNNIETVHVVVSHLVIFGTFCIICQVA